MNPLNQYTSRDVPNAFDVLGASHATNSVTVNGSAADYRRGEYFQELLTVVNSSTSVWQTVSVTNSGGGSTTGSVFVPKTPELFGYDSDGNLTNDGRWTLTWNAENRLVLMETLSSVPDAAKKKLAFGYDWQSRRISKTVSNWVSGAWQLGTSNKFLYDGWNLHAELDSNNTLVRSFIWGLDLSGTIQGAGGVGGLLNVAYYGAQTTNCFAAYDGNGNIATLVNAADGNVVANYEYDAFGQMIRATGVMATNNPVRFSTKYTDDQSDFLYYGYRYYNPSTGRWLSRDPIGERGNDDPLEDDRDLNLYAMVNNDPLNAADRLGLLSFSSGCIEKQKERIREAFAKACDKAKSCLHRFCLNDRSVSREMKKTCDGKDLHVVCHQKASRFNLCLSPIAGDVRCGYTIGGSIQPRHTIHLCPGAFDDPAGCGELGCTVLHEMTHAAGTGSEEKAQRSEVCSGMDCVTDPIKIRDLSKAPAHVSPCWCGRDD